MVKMWKAGKVAKNWSLENCIQSNDMPSLFGAYLQGRATFLETRGFSASVSKSLYGYTKRDGEMVVGNI